MTEGPGLKELGNIEFKKENYLRAAALYTKAIKEDPENAVLYSNRSAALLKLAKVTKALADADDCISKKPDWEKGYYRRAAALEAAEKPAEALEAYHQAHKLNPDNAEVASKIRMLSKLTRSSAKQHQPPQQTKQPPPKKADAVKQSKVEDSPAVKFAEDMIEYAKEQIQDVGSHFTPTVHFMPGKQAEPHRAEERNIQAAVAFESPDTFSEFVSYLRGVSKKLAASAACAVIPKAAVSYPQVWKKPTWALGQADGVFVQLESRKLRRLWFIQTDGKQVGQTQIIDYEFAAMPGLLT